MIKEVCKSSIITMALITLVGCAGNSLSAEAKQKINSNTGFRASHVSVTVVKNPFINEDEKHALYRSTTELSQLLKTSLQQQFINSHMDCKTHTPCLDVDIQLDYGRTFVMASNMLDTPSIALVTTLRKQNTNVHSWKESNLVLSRGTMNGLLTQTNIGSSKVDREQEASDVRSIAKEITLRINKLTH